MLKVALTGGIATGKTTVLGRLARLGVATIDADRIARDAVAQGTAGWRAVRARFGDSVLAPDGEIARGRLAALVFGDPAARRDLEAIVHPYVYEEIERWFSQLAAQDTSVGVADIPLLFETGHEGDFDVIVVTACAPDTQIQRVMSRDGLSEAEARRRLSAQWPIGDKRARADYVIETDGSPANTERQVDEMYRQIMTRASGRPR